MLSGVYLVVHPTPRINTWFVLPVVPSRSSRGSSSRRSATTTRRGRSCVARRDTWAAPEAEAEAGVEEVGGATEAQVPSQMKCPPPAGRTPVPTSSAGLAASLHRHPDIDVFIQTRKCSFKNKKSVLFFNSFTLMYIVELISVLYNIFGTTLPLASVVFTLCSSVQKVSSEITADFRVERKSGDGASRGRVGLNGEWGSIFSRQELQFLETEETLSGVLPIPPLCWCREDLLPASIGAL